MRQTGRLPAKQNRLDWIRRLGLIKAFRAVLWKLKTATFKRWIIIQDRFSWYSYAHWIRENEPVSPQPLPPDASLSASFLIYVAPESCSALAITLDSLKAQTYPHWGACLIIEPACAAEVQALLQPRTVDQPRLGVVQLDEGERLAGGLRRALDRTQGGWTGWMDCGDCLSPGALAACIEAIDHHPEADIIYTDEDYLDQDGRTRHDPFFKPDWSPDLLLSVNYLAHAFFRQDIFSASASEGDGLEDIVYHCAERAKSVVHIPQVLYHIHRGTGHRRPEDTPDGVNPGVEALSAHLQRIGLPGAALQVSSDGESHLTWTFQEQLISIIIPTRDQVQYLKRCIESLLSLTRYRRFEIILVENNSQEPETLAYYSQLQAVPQVRIIEDQRAFNYSSANNLGARQANGDWLLFLNNDIEIIEPGWLDEMARWVSRPEIGAVGARLLYPDGAIQHAGIIIGMEGHASHVFAGEDEKVSGPFGSSSWYRNYCATTGACMATRREVFDSTGGFDENYELVFSDVEYCQRLIQHGYRVVYTPFARLIHNEGRTRRQHIPVADIQRGADHFYQVVKQGDPYYNPNLSYTIRKPTLKRRGEEAPIVRLEKIVEYS
jgi:GT2 family glycosyltransferase